MSVSDREINELHKLVDGWIRKGYTIVEILGIFETMKYSLLHAGMASATKMMEEGAERGLTTVEILRVIRENENREG